MTQIALTTYQKKFIKKNRLKMTGTDMALHLGIDKGVLQRFMKKNGLTPPKEVQHKLRGSKIAGKTISNSDVDNFLRETYLEINVNTLSALLNIGETFIKTRLRQLGLVIPPEIIEQRKLDARIQPGQTPANKGKKQIEFMTAEAIERTKATRFKKGHLPCNAIGFEDGDISLRCNHKRDSINWHIRIGPMKWIPLQQYEWEKINGKQPKKTCISFIDGDSLNCRIENLQLISMKDNMQRNSASERLTDNFIAFTIAGKNGKHLLEDIAANKPLIEVKRALLLLNRTIKSKLKTNTHENRKQRHQPNWRIANHDV